MKIKPYNARIESSYICLEAPPRFQELVNSFLLMEITGEEFLEELKLRLGPKRPSWVETVFNALGKAEVKLIGVDAGEVKHKVMERMSLKKESVIEQAISAFYNGNHVLQRIFNVLKPLGENFAWFMLRNIAIILNLIPGDQSDYIAAYYFLEEEMCRELLERCDAPELFANPKHIALLKSLLLEVKR